MSWQAGALDLVAGSQLCMHGHSCGVYGIDNESTSRLHILDPGVRMRPPDSWCITDWRQCAGEGRLAPRRHRTVIEVRADAAAAAAFDALMLR